MVIEFIKSHNEFTNAVNSLNSFIKSDSEDDEFSVDKVKIIDETIEATKTLSEKVCLISGDLTLKVGSLIVREDNGDFLRLVVASHLSFTRALHTYQSACTEKNLPSLDEVQKKLLNSSATKGEVTTEQEVAKFLFYNGQIKDLRLEGTSLFLSQSQPLVIFDQFDSITKIVNFFLKSNHFTNNLSFLPESCANGIWNPNEISQQEEEKLKSLFPDQPYDEEICLDAGLNIKFFEELLNKNIPITFILLSHKKLGKFLRFMFDFPHLKSKLEYVTIALLDFEEMRGKFYTELEKAENLQVALDRVTNKITFSQQPLQRVSPSSLLRDHCD